MHSPLWTSTNEASSSILGGPTCGLGQEAQDRERRLGKQNWYCTMQDFSQRKLLPWSHDKLKQQEHIQKLRGKRFADLKECTETYPWMWERSYTVHWYRHILVWYWTSWQLNHLNGRKRWRPYKCRAELLFWECRKQPLVLSSGRN